ncbi:T9SS type A sorting domain-containing protein, partial [Bacteroidota bacterium]
VAVFISGIQNGSPDGLALIDNSGNVVQFLSYEGSFTAVGGPADGLTSVDIGVSEPYNTPVGYSLQLTGNGTKYEDFIWNEASANTFDDCNTGQTFGGGVTPSIVFINEIHYDNSGADTGEAVEVAGNAGADLTGWSLVFYNGNGGSSYRTYTFSETIPDICDGYGAVAVFISGIQNGSPDGLALVDNSGNVVQFLSYEGDFTASDGPAAGLTSEDIGVSEYSSTPVGYSLQLTGYGTKYEDFTWNTAAPNTFNDCNTNQTFSEEPPPLIVEIFDIQGSGLVSPYENQTVVTENNVVTALRPDGFFIQTPTARTDANSNTSDGIFVFLDAAPSVAVGDLVNVTGKVTEYFGFTELTNPVVNVIGTGAVPSSVVFDETTPSPDQPQSDIEFEQFESMLVSIPNGTVTGPNQGFGSDPIAEVYIVAKSSRTFREIGAEYPGLGASIPVWDGNPEVFELDPDKMGLPNQIIPAGSSFNAEGVIGFEFGGYELWPTSLSFDAAALPLPVRDLMPGEATVGSLNFLRLFDTSSNYTDRLNKFSLYIRNVMNSPDILAVQEVGDINVLQDLADKINADDSSILYSAFLEEGNDIGGIDVGFLVQENKVQLDAVTQLGKDETFVDPRAGSVDILHDRPPLLLEGSFIVNGLPFFPIKVMCVHMRSLNGIEGIYAQTKRFEQSQSVASKVQDLQDADPDVKIVVTGDFNAFEFTDGYVDVIGQITGNFDPTQNLLSGDDLVNPDLTNQVLSLPQDERYSYTFRGNAQVLDHALTSSGLNQAVTGFAYARANADAAEDLINNASTPLASSDHDGLVLYMEVTPPEITLSDPVSLWPPNHKYETFEVSDFVTSVTDNGIQMPLESVYITKVTSDEPENGDGDGNTTEDMVLVDCQTVDLRAERVGGGNGRVYTVHVAAQDIYGNTGTAEYHVNVPRDKKSSAVDDGALYEVVSDCLPPDMSEQSLNKLASQDVTNIVTLPENFVLNQNYPNPFNPTTTIVFELPVSQNITINIYNQLGQLVTTLVKGNYVAGIHSVRFNASNLPSGVYFYSITSDKFADVKKMMLIK